METEKEILRLIAILKEILRITKEKGLEQWNEKFGKQKTKITSDTILGLYEKFFEFLKENFPAEIDLHLPLNVQTITHFFNPDQKKFYPIDLNSEDLESLFQQHREGPLWLLWEDFDSKAETAPIFQEIEEMDENSFFRKTLLEKNFSSFLIIPMIKGEKFLGTVSLFFPNSIRLSGRELRELIKCILAIYFPIFLELYLKFEAEKITRGLIKSG